MQEETTHWTVLRSNPAESPGEAAVQTSDLVHAGQPESLQAPCRIELALESLWNLCGGSNSPVCHMRPHCCCNFAEALRCARCGHRIATLYQEYPCLQLNSCR